MFVKVFIFGLLFFAIQDCLGQDQRQNEVIPSIQKAAAPNTGEECLCQCSSLTFRSRNRIQGNCRRYNINYIIFIY